MHDFVIKELGKVRTGCTTWPRINDPQYVARKALVEVDHPTLGKLKFQGPVPKMSLTQPTVETPPPLLGQHNDYVYGEVLR